jgi:hypothetical protein
MHKKNIASITLAAWMFTVGGLMYLLLGLCPVGWVFYVSPRV